MAVYRCRSYKSRPYRKIKSLKISCRRFRSRVSRRILPIFYKCSPRLTAFTKRGRSFNLGKKRVSGKRNFLRQNIYPVRSFKARKFKSSQALRIYPVRSFKARKFRSKAPGIVLASSWVLSKKVYRHSNIYRPLFFQGSTQKRIILSLSINSRNLNQNSGYFFLSKLDLIEFGLIPSENNSLEEILASLLLFWENKLESSRINIVFYRSLKFKENSQWFESKSMLVNGLSLPSDSTQGFPSPRSFSI
jgi:hypothetical protein